MTWTAGPQADWVAEANRGERPEFRPAPELFEPAALLDAARGRHPGVGRFDHSLGEPLELLCAGLGSTARLTPLGRWATQRFLARLLDGHLALDDHSRTDPGVTEERIESPIFVVGAPRTGTTALHRLLAADPASRVPEGWEFALPVPPPEPATHDTDPRIEAARDELVFPQQVSEGLRSIHTYSARMPKECLSAMSFALRSEEFVSRYELPDYVAWLARCDMTPAYEMHRLVLQVLQRRMPNRRWVLKSPVHLQAVPVLVATYPDARFVVTHREPRDVLASVSSLIATLRSAFSDSVDPEAIGRYHGALYGASLDRLVDHVDQGLLPASRTVHVRHEDLVEDSLGVLDRVYDQLGLTLTADGRTAATRVVETAREDGPGSHHYELEDFGLDRARTTEAFARYRARFLTEP